MMVVIRGNDTLYDTDDYEAIQSAFEGYIYGSHRGEDLHNNKRGLEEGYKIGSIIKNRKSNTYGR